jgi:hypothetical protein
MHHSKGISRREFLAGAAAVPLLGSCSRSEKYDYKTTPAGYRLAWENVGAVPDWYSLGEIHTTFDGAVEAACTYLAKYGALPELVRAVAHGHKHVGFDAARFATSDSPTGWASGIWTYGHIGLAFWSRAKGDTVPDTAPPWTVYEWGSIRPAPKYDWGFEPPAFPALGHELGHAIWGPAFEHGWAPPIVSGAAPADAKDWSYDCWVRP